MYVQLYNLSGVKQKIQGIPGEIAAHATVQRFYDITPESFTHEDGVKVSKHLRRAKAAGLIDYQFVLEADDYGCGLVGTKTLVVDFARGHFTDADTEQTFTDDDALPLGATFLNAHLDVHTICTGGAVTANTVACGYASDGDAFDLTEDVYAGATRRTLTPTIAAGADIGGKQLQIVMTTVDGNVVALTQGKIELVVNYLLNPTL